MTAQALEIGRFAEGRGAEAAATGLGVAGFVLGAGFVTTSATGVAFAGAFGLVKALLTGLAAA